jgi:hypothetical protein
LENWESERPLSWAEFAAEYLTGVREEWVAAGPPRFCDREHPLGAACGACKDLRLMREEWDKRHAQWEQDRNDQRKAIDHCRMCDRLGHVWIEGWGPDPLFCEHDQAWIDAPLSSFGTVSSVPPDLKCEAVSDCLAERAIHGQPDGPPGQNGSSRGQCACGRPAPVDAETGLCQYCSIKASK